MVFRELYAECNPDPEREATIGTSDMATYLFRYLGTLGK